MIYELKFRIEAPYTTNQNTPAQYQNHIRDWMLQPVRIGSRSTEHWPSMADFSSSFFFLSFGKTSTTVTTRQRRISRHDDIVKSKCNILLFTA